MNQGEITYYDFSTLHYSSYFLHGFQQGTTEYGYRFRVSKAVPKLLHDLAMRPEWTAKSMNCICLFKANLSDEQFYFCIDTRDNSAAFNLLLLKKVRFYFKVNYNEDVIVSQPILSEYSNKIRPALPFFPVQVSPLRYFPRVVPSSVAGWSMKKARFRLYQLRNMIALDEMRQMRNLPKQYDIFFVTTYYHGKASAHCAANEFRYEIMKEIKKYKNANAIVGFASDKRLEGQYAELQLKPTTSIKEYLAKVAASRVAIYVRGVHDCISFKYGQMMAMGMPMVGQTFINNKSAFMDNPYFSDQFAYDSPDVIAQKAVELLENPDLLNEIAQSNAEVFDSKFAPIKVVDDILEHMQQSAI